MTPPWITKPDLYELTDEQYHADPVIGGSASSTVLKAMLPPSCPAKARHQMLNGRPPKRHYDVGLAAHAVILGEGREIAVWDRSTSWRSDAAQAFQAEHRAAGRIPLLAAEAEHVRGMRDAVLRHRQAGPLLEPGSFTAERAAVWRDAESGAMCRAKYDAVPHYAVHERLVIVDLKTGAAVDHDSLRRVVDRYGYDFSGAHYRNGALALNLGDDDTEFVLVFVEKEPPYCVHVARLVGPALRRAEIRVRKALDLWAACRAADDWPGYADDVVTDLDVPTWAAYQFDRAYDDGAFLTSGDLL